MQFMQAMTNENDFIGNSLNENAFKLLINYALCECEQKFVQKQNIEIQCDLGLLIFSIIPRWYTVRWFYLGWCYSFYRYKRQKSSTVEAKKNKPKKSAEDCITEKELEERFRNQVIDFQTQICLLENKLKQKEDEWKENTCYSKILKKLYDGGHIDKDGNIVSSDV